MSEDVEKTYTNGDITIVWKSKLCIHSGHCARSLPGVFSPKSRPWINMGGGTTDEIKRIVNGCPSGAISWHNNVQTQSDPTPEQTTRIELIPNGPLRVHGNIDITRTDGTTERREKITSLCRCGMSANKPFCDGTHKREGWKEN